MQDNRLELGRRAAHAAVRAHDRGYGEVGTKGVTEQIMARPASLGVAFTLHERVAA